MILDLHRQGLSLSAIARRTGLDRKTVRRCIARGLEAPVYSPRPPKEPVIAPWRDYLRQRVQAVPELTAKRLLREIRDLGYTGGYTAVKDYVRTVRPAASPAFERRFETPPGRQAQVDFAHFRATFTDEPGAERVVWLFSFVLGHSRFLWGRFVPHQDLQTVLRCLAAAFTAIGGVPEQLLFDRMKTAVQGDGDEGIVYNRTLLAFAAHHGFVPKACRPYRAKTKGKVERPFRYVRQDFFLGRTFRTLEDLNRQFDQWREAEANARLHATTRRIVAEHFAEEQPSLKPPPAGPFRAVLSLERRVTRDGMVSVGGNLYSVPDCTRRRAVEVRQARSRPLVEDLEAWMRDQRAGLSGRSALGKAMDYMLTRWEAFTRFLEDGRICLTNNAAERALRGLALGRKSWLFAGSDRGAARAAVMYTLIVTAKLNDIDPQAWLADVLARIADMPQSRLHELLPWTWKVARAENQAA